MTNAAIILENSLQLMEEGKLAGSGVWVTMVTDDGEKKVELPEEIHTFNGWKERGFRVKKGEKSEIKFAIWKHTVKEKKPEEKNWERTRRQPGGTYVPQNFRIFHGRAGRKNLRDGRLIPAGGKISWKTL